MRLLTAGLLLACAVCAQGVKGERIVLDAPPFSQLAKGPGLFAVGKRVRVGKVLLRARVKGDQLLVGRRAGAGATDPVEPGKPFLVSVRGKQHALGFVRGPDGAWRYYRADAWQYKLGEETIRIVDLDGNGVFELAKDGYMAYGSPVACPLAAEFVLGRSVVRLKKLARDGGRLDARLSPVEAHPAQLGTLVEINRVRARHGLSPVRLDATLCRGCTAHAEYLRVNSWTGRTNPHSQNLGPDGASEEGANAARRSIISSATPAGSVMNFWRTYYHRFPLITPTLRMVGVNATEGRIAVLDTAQSHERVKDKDWVWRDVVAVPADGSVGFPTAAVSERPRDPVPDMNRRGNPLQFYFRQRVSGFLGKLVEVEDGAKVPVLVVAPERSIGGLVPESALKEATWYRATVSFEAGGKSLTRTVTFRTK